MKTARRKSIERSRLMVVAWKGFSLISALPLRLRRSELPDINFQPHRGFSLIELMVVITLFTITTIAVTTSYISFQDRETLKSAALQLKTDLRQAQNSALIGDKVSNDSGGCQTTTGSPAVLTSKILGGWYLSISLGGTSYTVSGVCLNSASSYAESTFGAKTTTFPTGVTVSAITCTVCGSTTFSTGTPPDSLSVFFVPLTNTVSFFKNPTTNNFFDSLGLLNSSIMTGYGEAVITMNSGDANYEIHINQGGDIREVKI